MKLESINNISLKLKNLIGIKTYLVLIFIKLSLERFRGFQISFLNFFEGVGTHQNAEFVQQKKW